MAEDWAGCVLWLVISLFLEEGGSGDVRHLRHLLQLDTLARCCFVGNAKKVVSLPCLAATAVLNGVL